MATCHSRQPRRRPARRLDPALQRSLRHDRQWPRVQPSALAAGPRTAYRPPYLRHRHGGRWGGLVPRPELGAGLVALMAGDQGAGPPPAPSRLALARPRYAAWGLDRLSPARPGLAMPLRLGGGRPHCRRRTRAMRRADRRCNPSAGQEASCPCIFCPPYTRGLWGRGGRLFP